MIKKISCETMDVQTKKITERAAHACIGLCKENCGATYNPFESAAADILQMG